MIVGVGFLGNIGFLPDFPIGAIGTAVIGRSRRGRSDIRLTSPRKGIATIARDMIPTTTGIALLPVMNGGTGGRASRRRRRSILNVKGIN